MELAPSSRMHDSPSHAPNAAQAGASAAPPAFVSVAQDWTCPFCPLLCDDIEARVRDDQTIAAPATNCPRLAQALTHFGAADSDCAPSLDGQPVSRETALARAAQMLAHAHRPLFGACATDVAGARALYELAAGCGAILDTLHGAALGAATLALQDRGALFTTLSEVRSRADLLIVFGCTPGAHHPRFYERTLAGSTRARDICFVACATDPAAGEMPHARCDAMLEHASPYDVLALWSALAEGRSPAAFASGAEDVASIATQLASLMARIAAARYTVLVYEPAALPQPHAALLIEALHRIVKALNRTCRAGVLALGGADGALTVNQAFTWLSGLPLATRVARHDRPKGAAPLEHDPYRYRTERLLAAREIDALLWVTSFEPHPLPDTLDPQVPAIVLGPPALAERIAARGAPTVFIPVATPGIDGNGHLFRLDTSVVAPLAAARQVNLPSVAELAADLAERVAAQRRPS
jgi:formylmethanofuran dehydrogenase subunit B